MLHPAALMFDALLLLAAASDVTRYRIPNALAAALALGGLVEAFAATPAEAASRIVSFAAVGLVAGALWLRGLLGGGDLKLLMACALWIPLSGLTTFALALGVASIVQALAALGWTCIFAQTPLAAGARNRLPYGVSIATAGLIWSAAQMAAS
jgi:prepilin peptidase CpaA